MARDNKLQVFVITQEVFVGSMKNETENEQIAIKRDGTVIHQKICGGKLAFSYSAELKDLRKLSAFFDSGCIKAIASWGEPYDRYHTMRCRSNRYIFKERPVYRR